MLLRRLLLASCSALALAGSAQAQGINLTNTILSAPPATYPPSPLDRIPIVQTRTSPGSVPGTYALSLPASLFAPAPYINAQSYNIPPVGTDGTAQAQAASDAAAALAPSTLYFPNAFDFTGYLAVYAGVNVVCGGVNNQINRTGTGPGIYTALSTATRDYPSFFVTGSMTNCAVDGGGHPGSNFTFAEAYPYSLRNITGTGTDTAASQIMAGVNGAILTVASVDYGTVKPNQFLICQECGTGNTSGNTYPIIQPYGTSGTSGTGGTGTYALNVNFAIPVTTNAPMITSTPWTWASAIGGRTSFPSANAYLMGATEVNWTGGFLGNNKTATSNTCTNFNGIGLILDTPTTGGGSKPNANVLIGVLDQCDLLGMGVFNGGDNVFIAGLHQNDVIGELYGTGAGNAIRNHGIMMYYEPQSNPNGRAGFIFGPIAHETHIDGVGSTNSANFQPVIIDTFANGSTRNKVTIVNDQTFYSEYIVDTFYSGANQANPPVAVTGQSHMLDSDDTHSAENSVKTYQAADVPMHVGYFQRGAHGSPAVVGIGDVLWLGGGRGQYDTTVDHVCDTASVGNYTHAPCGFISVVADGTFSATSWPTRIDFYNTPAAATQPLVRWTIGKTGGLFAATLDDLGGGSVNMVWGKTKPTAFSTLATCDASLEGAFEAVNNSVSAVWGDAVVNGGANHVLAFCDGTNWTVAAK